MFAPSSSIQRQTGVIILRTDIEEQRCFENDYDFSPQDFSYYKLVNSCLLQYFFVCGIRAQVCRKTVIAPSDDEWLRQ